jgi:hypothetical protein
MRVICARCSRCAADTAAVDGFLSLFIHKMFVLSAVLQGSPIEFKVHDRDVTEAAAKSRPGSANVTEWSGCPNPPRAIFDARIKIMCLLLNFSPPTPPQTHSLESVDRERSSKPPPPNNYAVVSADISPLSRGEVEFVVRADMRPARLRLPAGELASLIPPGAYIDASSFLTVSDAQTHLLLMMWLCMFCLWPS